VFQRWAAAFKQDQQDDEEANSLPAINAVKTSEEPAENGQVVLASDASGGNGEALPGVNIGAEPPAKIGKSDSVAPKSASQEIDIASLPIPAMSPKRLAGAANALALVAANPGARQDQVFAAVDRTAATEKLRNKLAEGSFTVAALSADDIEKMRRSAVPANGGQDARGSLQDRLASGLVPAVQVGSGQANGSVERRPEINADLVLARLNQSDPARAAERQAADKIGKINVVPKKNPDRHPPAAAGSRTLELALAPSEQNLNAAADAIRALIEANGEPTGSIRSAREEDHAGRNGIGDWALAGSDLQRTGEFRAPAFGMGAFRPSPAEVLRAGFQTDQRVASNGFEAGATQADFVRFARR
jgi:hypothetical protein